MKLVTLTMLAVGAAGTVLPGYKAVSRVDNYDKGIPITEVKTNEPGYINYNAWSYVLAVAPKAPSGANVIGTGVRGQATAGQPAFLPKQGVKCFDMKSIRNACFANLQVGAVGVPTSCSVQFSARSALKKTVKTRIAVYNPDPLLVGPLATPYNTTVFPSPDFDCIDRVDITLLCAALPGDGVVVAVTLDDFSYQAYVKQK